MERARKCGYRVIEYPDMLRELSPVKDYRNYRRMIRDLKQLKPDVVHTHSSKAGIIGRWAARRAGVPVIIHTIHGLAFTASTSKLVNGVYRQAEKITAPISTRIACVADAMAEQSLAGGVGVRKQYITVYSGMDTAPFLSPATPRDLVRKSLGIARDDVVVGTIARLFYLKGHDDLLAIAPDLHRSFPKLKFMWVGDGLLREQFERRISEMGMKDRFVLTGLVPPTRIPELVNAMDVLVHPSRREGLARAIVQGSLAAKPVITYDIDGNREAMVPLKTGYLLHPFDTQKLRDALSLLLESDSRRSAMGSAGREFVLERFSSERMVDSLERLYNVCLEEKRVS